MTQLLQDSLRDLNARGFSQLAAQIFISGPNSFRSTLSKEEAVSIGKLVRSTGMQLVIHGAYVDNPWSRQMASVHNIRQEMISAHVMGATGVIVHLSRHAFEIENISFVLEAINKNMPQDVCDGVILWLEMHSAKPSQTTYETPQKINLLFDKIKTCSGRLTVGFCIDTAHAFSSGQSFATAKDVTEWLHEIKITNPIMLHLNDSASKFASGQDTHMGLCQGNIWKDYHPVHGSKPIKDSGLVVLLDYAEANNILVILERNPRWLNDDLDLLEQLQYF